MSKDEIIIMFLKKERIFHTIPKENI